MRVFSLIALCALSSPALAGQTCKYVDAEGRITFANVPVKNARKVMCFDPVPRAAPKRSARAQSPRTDAPSQGAAPARIDPKTQQRRDADRRLILEQELAEEQGLLEAARRLAADSRAAPGTSPESALEDVSRVLDAIRRHERNIEAIRRELSLTR